MKYFKSIIINNANLSENEGFKDPLHNSLWSVISRTRAVCCVVFLGKAQAIACKKTPCSPSRSDCHSLARVMQRVLNVQVFFAKFPAQRHTRMRLNMATHTTQTVNTP